MPFPKGMHIAMVNQYRDRPRFADDEYDRGHYSVPRQADGDPLAELARLIGQTDPFSGFGQERQPAAPRQDFHAPREEPESYDDPLPGPPPWVRNSQAAARQHQHYVDEPQYQDHQPQSADWHDQEQESQHTGWPRATDYGYGRESEYEPQVQAHMAYDDRAAHYDDPSARYDDVLYGQQDHRGYGASYGADQGYDDQAYDQSGFYADGGEGQPENSRRSGKMTVLVVLALAVVGTAAAYGYRSLSGGSRSGAPPVIKADAGPNKIIPPSQSAENKPAQDRIGEKIAERVVSREEQPVDINAKSGPRIVFPPLTRNAQPPNVTSVSPSSPPVGVGTANGTLNGAEPRKIRTLSIRPDRADAAPTASTSAQPEVRNIPITAPRSAPPPAQPTSASNAPMALTPQGAAHDAQEPRARVASVNPAATAPSSATGPYVQVSSQRSEADAKTSYRVLQGKYPGILGSRPPVIKRADLGSKGVFYRALVGPFAAADEATQFCVNLQSAGGKCIVQRH
ncbi:MAG: SPOR domain-containing protein [Afipia sp.]